MITEELREKLIGRLVMVLGAGTDEECAICLESLNVPVITHCAHVFCRPCIESVIQNERVSEGCFRKAAFAVWQEILIMLHCTVFSCTGQRLEELTYGLVPVRPCILLLNFF